MTVIIAIDPGSQRSAWIAYDTTTRGVRGFAIIPNIDLLTILRNLSKDVELAVIEKIESYGMAVGADIFDTVHWTGRFHEALESALVPVVNMPRRAVKLALCGNPRAKDANIRVALLDRFGGKSVAVGVKRTPGPLYGISRDVWSALAIAVTYADMEAAA